MSGATITNNTINYGLDMVHVFKITGTDAVSGLSTYAATPIKVDGAVNISLTPKGESLSISGDNIEDYYTMDNNQGYDGSVEIVSAPTAFLTDILGLNLTSDGVLEEYATQKFSPFALCFQFLGDKKSTRHCLYYCKISSRPKIESATTSDKTDVKNVTVDFKVIPRRKDKLVKRSTTPDVTTIYDSWFTAPYEPVVG